MDYGKAIKCLSNAVDSHVPYDSDQGEDNEETIDDVLDGYTSEQCEEVKNHLLPTIPAFRNAVAIIGSVKKTAKIMKHLRNDAVLEEEEGIVAFLKTKEGRVWDLKRQIREQRNYGKILQKQIADEKASKQIETGEHDRATTSTPALLTSDSPYRSARKKRALEVLDVDEVPSSPASEPCLPKKRRTIEEIFVGMTKPLRKSKHKQATIEDVDDIAENVDDESKDESTDNVDGEDNNGPEYRRDDGLKGSNRKLLVDYESTESE